MSAYSNNPYTQIPLLLEGVPVYSLGSYNNYAANPRMQITNVSLTANVATITGQIVEGGIPTVGNTISVTQTQTNPSVFNVNRATITAVSINSLGVGTISYAVTNADISTVADVGTAIADVPEVGETLVAGASMAIAVQHSPAQAKGQRQYATNVTFPGGLPTAVTVVLQGAVRNFDSDYVTIANTGAVVAAGAYTTGPVTQVPSVEYNYFRFLVSGLTGTANVAACLLG